MKRTTVECPLCMEHCLVDCQIDKGKVVLGEGHRCSLGEVFLEAMERDHLSIFEGLAFAEEGECLAIVVRTTGKIPNQFHSLLQKKLKKMLFKAPIQKGSILISNILNTKTDLVACRNIFHEREISSPFFSFLYSIKKPPFQIGLCAHRGNLKETPENTLVAFQSALNLGVDCIEMDIHFTKDKKIVVIHDEEVNRTTNGKGAIHKFTLEEIKNLSAGEWFGDEFSKETVPTLRETLELLKGKAVPIIEIKNPLELNQEIEKPLFELLEELNMTSQVMLSTRSLEYAEKLKDLSPSTWILHLSITKKQMRQVLDTKIDGVTPYWRTVTADFVKAYRKKNKVIVPWTVNSIASMKAMIHIGVDAIISDYPVDLINLLVNFPIKKINPSIWKQAYYH